MATALFLGSTGEVGKQVLKAAIASDEIASIYTFGRSKGPEDPKVKQELISYDKLLAGDAEEVAKVKAVRADVVYLTLGTTKKAAGGAEQFIKIDREFAVAGAAAARCNDKEQTLVYCSSTGASPHSRFLYLQSKGITEQRLAALYPKSVIFRPGFLEVPGGRGGHIRWNELAAYPVVKALGLFSTGWSIPTPVLGRAILRGGLQKVGVETDLGVEGGAATGGPKAWVVDNAEAVALGK